MLHIKNEVEIIIANIGEGFNKFLLDNAVKYLILHTIHKNKICDTPFRYFSDATEFVDFTMWLMGSPHNPQGLSDSQIGKCCTTLFLVYDRCSIKKLLYDRIAKRALKIIHERLPKSTLFELVDREKLQFENILKECENPPQNRTEIIGCLKEYLNSINAYLDAEGLFKEEDI